MRNRFIRPGFFSNYELSQLPPLTRILFQGLWCLADKAGRLLDRPPQIKAQCLPYDEINPNEALQQLHDAGFIVRYKVDGRAYIEVVNFNRHQPLTTWENKNTSSGIPAIPTVSQLHSDDGRTSLDQQSAETQQSLPDRTHTTGAPPSNVRPIAEHVGVGDEKSSQNKSRFTLEDCRRYARHLQASGQGITNPGGYGTSIHRSGEADTLIAAFLEAGGARGSPAALVQTCAANCDKCYGTGQEIVVGKGARPCPNRGKQAVGRVGNQ